MTAQSKCRCDGSGAYTVSIPVADAVVSIPRQCPVHGGQVLPERTLVRDRANHSRVGEVMDQRSTSDGPRLDLRPPGGGREWVADPAHLEPVRRSPLSGF